MRKPPRDMTTVSGMEASNKAIVGTRFEHWRDGPAGPFNRPREAIFDSWLADSDLVIFCGNWENGGMMELLPRGRARLSGPRYDVPFDGLRELRLDGGVGHHVHLDLGRLSHAWYFVAPSVCYGYRPSFELRLTSGRSGPRDGFGVGLALTHPYAGRSVRAAPVQRYFRRAAEHIEKFPETVSFMCDRAKTPPDMSTEWNFIESLLAEVEASSAYSMRSMRAALRDLRKNSTTSG